MIVVGQLRMSSPRPNLVESGELSENILPRKDIQFNCHLSSDRVGLLLTAELPSTLFAQQSEIEFPQLLSSSGVAIGCH